jgi:hypothetical protein
MDASDVPVFTARDILRHFKQLPITHGGGDDGWNALAIAALLKHVKTPRNGLRHDDFVAGLVTLVNDIAAGRLTTPELKPLLTTFKGVALRKAAGSKDVRPIGIAQLFVIAAESLVMRSKELKKRVNDDTVGPNQLGAGKRGGCEAVPATVTALLKRNPGHVALKTDVKNAFNSVLRSHVLPLAQTFEPLAPLIELLYGEPARIRYRDRDGNVALDVQMQRGVVQGSASGSLLYAAATRTAVVETAKAHPTVTVFGYADDIYIVGPVDDTLAALATYEAKLALLGLELQRAKSQLIDPAGDGATPGKCAAASVTLVAGFAAAGTPVGSAAFVHSELSGIVDEYVRHVGRVRRLTLAARGRGDPLTAQLFKLVRWCLAPAKATYLLRTVPVDDVVQHIHRYDDAVFDVVRHILELEADARADPATAAGQLLRQRAELHGKSGGLGVANSAVVAAENRYGSLALVGALVRGIVGSTFDVAVCLPELDVLRARFADNPTPQTKDRSAADHCADQLIGITAKQSLALREQRRDAVLGQLADLQAKAWLRSCGGEGHTALLAEGGFNPLDRLSARDFTTLARVRLGLPATDSTPVNGNCPHCKGKPIEPTGLHALHCGENGKGGLKGHRGRHHKAVLHALRRALDHVAAQRNLVDMARMDGESAGKEPLAESFWRRNPGAKVRRTREGAVKPPAEQRADLMFHHHSRDPARSTVIDLVLSFANPLSGTDKRSASVDGHAADVAHKRKLALYNDLFVIPPGQFMPFSIELGGRMHTGARDVLAKFVRGLLPDNQEAWDPDMHLFYATSVRYLIESVEVATAKTVAGTLRLAPSGVPLNAAAPGGGGAAGADEGSDDDGDGDAAADAEPAAAPPAAAAAAVE